MVEGGYGKAFPLMFYDGEREMNIGSVQIYPSLDLKTFQSTLSQKIGISPNQMSIYLVDRKKPKLSYEDRRKILITGGVSFALIAREKDCFILVVLKRSRRDRRRKLKQSSTEFGDYFPGNNSSPLPEKLPLLHRTRPDLNNTQITAFVSPYYNQVAPPMFGSFNDPLQKLQVQRENYMTIVSNSNLNLGLYSFPKIVDSYVVSALCVECTNAKNGKAVPFHCCVNDAVAVAFRSPAGLIARPINDKRLNCF